MKRKIFIFLIIILGIHITTFSQDTLHKSTKRKTALVTNTKVHKKSSRNNSSKKPLYRDTRLGSSSPKYDTYKKNKKGAGAVTTSPK